MNEFLATAEAAQAGAMGGCLYRGGVRPVARHRHRRATIRLAGSATMRFVIMALSLGFFVTLVLACTMANVASSA